MTTNDTHTHHRTTRAGELPVAVIDLHQEVEEPPEETKPNARTLEQVEAEAIREMMDEVRHKQKLPRGATCATTAGRPTRRSTATRTCCPTSRCPPGPSAPALARSEHSRTTAHAHAPPHTHTHHRTRTRHDTTNDMTRPTTRHDAQDQSVCSGAQLCAQLCVCGDHMQGTAVNEGVFCTLKSMPTPRTS